MDASRISGDTLSLPESLLKPTSASSNSRAVKARQLNW